MGGERIRHRTRSDQQRRHRNHKKRVRRHLGGMAQGSQLQLFVQLHRLQGVRATVQEEQWNLRAHRQHEQHVWQAAGSSKLVRHQFVRAHQGRHERTRAGHEERLGEEEAQHQSHG